MFELICQIVCDVCIMESFHFTSLRSGIPSPHRRNVAEDALWSLTNRQTNGKGDMHSLWTYKTEDYTRRPNR